jgi:hypothetical protein
MAVKRYNGTSWDTVAGLGAQGAAATSSSITTWVKTAAGGETSLSGSSDSSTTLAYTPGQEQFFINGVLQVRGSDYTATNGTSITGITALIAGDVATVTTVNAFSVTGAVPLSTVTANGDLIVGTSSGAVGRLGVGSTGQLLTVSGGVPTWAAAPAAGSNWSLLNTGGTALTGAAIITVSSVPTGTDKIMVLIKAASSNSANTQIGVRFNSDGASNYYQYGFAGNANASYSVDVINGIEWNDNYAWIAQCSGSASSEANGFLLATGCSASGLKVFTSAGGANAYGSSGVKSLSTGGYWNNSSAITSVSVRTANGNFDNGTVFVYTSA